MRKPIPPCRVIGENYDKLVDTKFCTKYNTPEAVYLDVLSMHQDREPRN